MWSGMSEGDDICVVDEWVRRVRKTAKEEVISVEKVC